MNKKYRKKSCISFRGWKFILWSEIVRKICNLEVKGGMPISHRLCRCKAFVQSCTVIIAFSMLFENDLSGYFWNNFLGSFEICMLLWKWNAFHLICCESCLFTHIIGLWMNRRYIVTSIFSYIKGSCLRTKY